MQFADASKLGALIAKDYAQDFFLLLARYRDISASEAASRLELHIQTAQDFLETLAELGVLKREEVHEGKRPYFRYTLVKDSVEIAVDLRALAADYPEDKRLSRKIREHRRAPARFSAARSGDQIGSVTLWSGKGRGQRERRISLTGPQGRFLFHLPFPSAEPLSISEIMRRGDLDEASVPEILDIVGLLTDQGVIEELS